MNALGFSPDGVVDPGVSEREVVVEQDDGRVAEGDLEAFLASGEGQLNLVAGRDVLEHRQRLGRVPGVREQRTLTSAQRGVPSLLM